jgi:hypothetical protein
VRRLYAWKTRVGPFYIAEHEGRYHVLFRDDSLGSYINPAQALDDLVGGHTFSAGPGIDTSDLEIPDELSEWEPLR